MSSNPREAVAPLRLIEAAARQLADEIEAGKLWDGDYDKALATIGDAFRKLPRGNRR